MSNFARLPVTVLELELDKCLNTYGAAPCTAAGASGAECYNTWRTCQDRANYQRGTRTLRFVTTGAPIPAGANLRPYIKAVKFAPTEIDPEAGLARRASVTVTMVDEPDADVELDPYVATRASKAAGSFWSRFLARNHNYTNRVARIRRAYFTNGWNDAEFVDEEYIVEQIKGPSSSDEIQITLKDPIKLADRAQVPAPSSGKLAVDITASDLSIPLVAGDGAQYEDAGLVRIGEEVIRYARRLIETGWNFVGNNLEGFSAVNATLASGADTITATGTGSGWRIVSGAASIYGYRYRNLILRARLLDFRPGGLTWVGTAYYQTSQHGESASYKKTIAEPVWNWLNGASQSENFAAAAWTKTVAVASAAATITTADGQVVTCDTLTDSSGAASQYAQTDAFPAATGRVATACLHVKKDAVGRATRFPAMRLAWNVSGKYAEVYLDTATGETSSAVSSAVTLLEQGAEDGGDHWRLYATALCTDAGALDVDLQVYPAAGAGAAWSLSAATTGAITAGGAQLTHDAGRPTYVKTTALPASEFVDIVFDMHALTAGGDDWKTNTILALRFDLFNDSGAAVEIDFIGWAETNTLDRNILSLASSADRAQYGTSSAAHKAGEVAQQCLGFNGARVADVLLELLLACGMPRAMIDYAGMSAEDTNWLGDKYLVTTCLSEPEDVSTYLGELAVQTGGVIWWRPDRTFITYKYVGPSSPGVSIGRALTDEANIISGSAKIEALDALRKTMVAINYDLASATANREEAKNFKRGEVHIDADAESVNEYGDQRDEVIYSRWFTAQNQAALAAYAKRRLGQYRDAPKKVEIKVDPKDADVVEGELYDVETESLVDFAGNPSTVRCLVVKRQDNQQDVSLTLRTTNFGRRYGFIAPNGTSNYPANAGYACIAPDDGQFSDGGEAYRII